MIEIRRNVSVLIALAVTMALAGCGGGGSSTTSTASTGTTAASAPNGGGTLSSAEYDAQVNAICKSTRAQTASLLAEVQGATLTAVKSPSSATVAPLLALVKRLHASAGQTLSKLHALKPPAAVEERVESFVVPLTQAIDGLERATVGIEHGQAKQAVSSLFALQSSAPMLAQAATTAGLGECGGILSATG